MEIFLLAVQSVHYQYLIENWSVVSWQQKEPAKSTFLEKEHEKEDVQSCLEEKAPCDA